MQILFHINILFMNGFDSAFDKKIKILQHLFDIVIIEIPKNDDTLLKNEYIAVWVLRENHLII